MATYGITCRACGVQFIHKRTGQRGRPPVICDECRARQAQYVPQKRVKRVERPRPPCEGCGKVFDKTAKGLCRNCAAEQKKIRRVEARRAMHGRAGLPPLLRLKSIDDAATRTLHTCRACGCGFYPRKSGHTKFCGRDCGLAFTGLKSALMRNHGIVRHQIVRAKCGHCRARFTQTHGALYCGDVCRVGAAEAARVVKDRAAYVSRKFQCKCCGAPVETNYGDKQRSYCSLACMSRLTRRVQKKARDAKIRGASRVDRIDPTRVFERDGWRCGICGKLTLKSKRGTAHPRAPELDHIVTLADGGEHTYANTQCSCRRCNGAKGAKTYGQLHLFPAG
jgi:5-methylcytosine-specific restriction endonuclease McrA